MADAAAAIQSLRPGAQWSIKNGNLTSIVWLDQVQTRPTDVEINAEIVRLNALPGPTLADNIDLLTLKVMFNHENRTRVLEGKVAITMAQFKAALVVILT